MKQRHPGPPRGFTLTEMLVVILIIAVIATLSMMGISRMRAAGDRATTMMVMRQFQVANIGYATENNGYYVPVAELNANDILSLEWFRNPKFLVHLYGDPSVFDKSDAQLQVAPPGNLDPVAYRAKKRYYDQISASFGINAEDLNWPKKYTDPPMSYRVSDVTNPGRTAFLATAVNYQFKHDGRMLWKQEPVEGKVKTNKMAFRHGGKAVVVFYDGSIGMIGHEDIKRFDSNGGKENPFWKAKQ